MIPFQSRVSVPEKVIFREIGDEAVLVDLESGHYFGLNETATEMWNYLVESKSPAAALAQLLQVRDVSPEILERDLAQLVEELVARRLLNWDAE